MTMMKNYWGFTSWLYRLLMWVIFPTVALGTILWAWVSSDSDVVVIPTILCLVIAPIIDVMSDVWLLPGFYVKGNSSLEFLQSTTKFSTMIRDVVVVDIIKRVVFYVGTYALLFVVCANKEASAKEFIEVYGYQPVLNILVVQIAVFIARFFGSVQQVFGIAMFSSVPNAIYILLVKPLPMEIERIYVIGMAVLSVVVIAVTIWFSLKKVRDSFYDQ